MRAWVAASCVIAVTASVHAGPTEDVIVAAMRLAEATSYSWRTSITDNARSYEIEARTIRGGFTRVKMPVVAALRRKLGRSVTDMGVELIFRGNTACIIETETGWLLPSELPTSTADDTVFGQVNISLAGSGGGPGGEIPPRPTAPIRGPLAYSNLQLALSHPHEELAVIVSGHTNLLIEGETASGMLTELAAQLLLVHEGQNELSPAQAGGRFKLWLRHGTVTRYRVELDGVLSVATRRGRQAIRVRQTTDTRIKEVGTTVFDVPEEARLKLGLATAP